MKKNGRKIFTVSILGALFILGVMSPAFAADTVKLRTLSSWPKTTFEVAQFMKWVEAAQKEADQKYPGQLKIDYRGAGEVISNREQVEALRSGLVDMVCTAASYYTSIMPEMDTMSLSELMPWEERAAGVYAYLEGLHNKKANAHFLSRFGTGSLFQMFLNKAVDKSSDLDGLKIRVSPTHIPFMKALGAEPIGMPPTDIYTAIERGVVDGYIQPPAVIRDLGLVPVTKYMVNPGFYQPVMTVLINKDVWDKIPAHLQTLLTETMKQAEHNFIEATQAKNAEEFASFKKDGMTFIDLADAGQFSKMAADALKGVVFAKAPEESKKLLDMITK